MLLNPKRLATTIVTVGLLFAVSISTPYASEEGALTAANKAEIEKMIEGYILENPEIVIQAIRKFQAQQRDEEEARQRQAISNLSEQLKNTKTSPARGNLEGDITLVEFFDYRCPYCKRGHKVVMDAIKRDGNVRLVYKEFPILGPDSTFASRASLGVFYAVPDKYDAFHDALIGSTGNLTQDRVLEIAENIGLSRKDVEKSMKDPRVDREIAHNMALAQSLGINGTPAYVIEDTLVPGAVELESLLQMFKEARGS